MDNLYLTTAQAARRLGVDVSTINRWCRSGVLAGASLQLGRQRLGYRIPEASIAAMEARYVREPVSA